MGAGEGVVDVDVAELGERLGEGRVVLFLALVEAQVLQHGDVARLHARNDAFGGRADAVGGELHRAAEQGGKGFGDRLEGEGRLGPALGAAEVRDDDDLGAALRTGL